MEKNIFEILKISGVTSYQIPVYIESSVDEMGGMVGFDGAIEQVEQLCNFSYTQTGSTVQVYITVNPDKLRVIKEQVFTLNWGDGNSDSIGVTSGIYGSQLPTTAHTYTTNGQYSIEISLSSPWTTQRLNKIITIPKNITVMNPLGTYSGYTIPYTDITGTTQDYLNDLDYNSTSTDNTTFRYVSIGGSKIVQKKLYGNNGYNGVTIGVDSFGVSYSAYTIDNLNYIDYSDGYTMITGTTVGYTKEEVLNAVLTRNEHFLGFIEEPTIYSDIFVERGKTTVMENNFRLGDVSNMVELTYYGGGYFTIKKQ